ncbi:uncharacterized protein LOC127079951 [Lathyrus oleraceus]|uniref:Uncharacterized protein n=1 Tax=Pisum sativum TaxID=3888 RepID=A0A9D5BDR5_PEA|nr:uncharacterized protein LOC127079951 [Pisum sativum]KAI5441035.1 hypothetical protein KIW84_010480 [Pisum sativum]
MEIVTHSYHHSYNYYFRIFAYHGSTNFCKLSARKILPEPPPSINWMVYWHQQHSINGTNLMVNKSVISWKSDREHKFGKHVFAPKNFRTVEDWFFPFMGSNCLFGNLEIHRICHGIGSKLTFTNKHDVLCSKKSISKGEESIN